MGWSVNCDSIVAMKWMSVLGELKVGPLISTLVGETAVCPQDTSSPKYSSVSQGSATLKL